MSDLPWYERFFGNDYLRLYRPYLTPERTERELTGMLALLQLAPTAKILDLACGYGRHSIPLAALGFRVTGLDLSRTMLRRARVTARGAGVEVRWVHADMREIPFTDEFDAIINIFNAFGYLENEGEDQKVLDRVALALAPGGVFLMETVSRDSLVRYFQPADIDRLEDGTLALQEQAFDPLAGRLNVRLTMLYPDGGQAAYGQSIRFYTLTELAAMLARAGLRLAAYWGELDGSALASDSRHLVLLAHKSPRPGEAARGETA